MSEFDILSKKMDELRDDFRALSKILTAPAPVTSPKGYMTRKESAEFLGISNTTFGQKLKEGIIPAGTVLYAHGKPKWRVEDLIAIK
jgi:hypothetical protein